MIPTSNHNKSLHFSDDVVLFISWFLHQTTTVSMPMTALAALFISWFLHQTTTSTRRCPSFSCCLSLDSYIKPQPALGNFLSTQRCLSLDSYIKPQQCILCIPVIFCCLSLDSYIKPQHKQRPSDPTRGCLSLDSYIKPQQYLRSFFFTSVVYLLIPTSNHNYAISLASWRALFISWFLHQTTTENLG